MMHDQGKGLAKAYLEPAAEEFVAEPVLDRAIQARIGEKLRAMYDELLDQPVPDRFADLLDRLSQREG